MKIQQKVHIEVVILRCMWQLYDFFWSVWLGNLIINRYFLSILMLFPNRKSLKKKNPEFLLSIKRLLAEAESLDPLSRQTITRLGAKHDKFGRSLSFI